MWLVYHFFENKRQELRLAMCANRCNFAPMQLLNVHHRQLLKLGAPLAVGQIGILIQTFADDIMVGQYGTYELAAAGFVNSIFGTVLFLLTGFAFGFTPLLSGHFGRGEHRALAALFKQGLMLSTLFNGLLLLAMLGLYRWGFPNMVSDPKLLPYVSDFFWPIWVSMLFLSVFQYLRQLPDVCLDTKVGMWLLIVGNVVNLLGNWLLIYGVGPFPEWGLFGAGVATLVSRVVMLVGLVSVLIGRTRYREYLMQMRGVAIQWGKFMRWIGQCLPVALQMGMESSVFTIATIMAGQISTETMAAFRVMMSVSLLGYLLYVSFAQSTSLRIGTAAGQADWEAVAGNAKAGRDINIVLALLVSAFLWFEGDVVIGLFTDDAKVFALAVATMSAMIVYQISDAIQVTLAQSLRGLSHVRSMMVMGFVGYFVVGIPASYWLGVVWLENVAGLLLGLTLALISSSLLYWWRLNRVIDNKEIGFQG